MKKTVQIFSLPALLTLAISLACDQEPRVLDEPTPVQQMKNHTEMTVEFEKTVSAFDLKITLDSVLVETWEPDPDNPDDHGGGGIFLTFILEHGRHTESVELSELSTPDQQIDTIGWRGYEIHLRKVESPHREAIAHLTVSKGK